VRLNAGASVSLTQAAGAVVGVVQSRMPSVCVPKRVAALMRRRKI
jgi:hypothetical protein